MSGLLDAVGIVALIFGGCCSNVFALETILQSEPGSGLLITFVQFVLTAGASYLAQASSTKTTEEKQNQVPLSRWAFIAALFCGINVLNNWAFAFNISVPVHIILRSFGSVTTMIAGTIRGKRYSALQILSVVILTIGVLVSAWADSEGKGKSMSIESKASSSQFTQGLLILLAAQFMSAYMGAFVEETYSSYKATWTENMFYSHFFSLPFFLPFSGKLQQQYESLSKTEQVRIREVNTSSSTISTTSHVAPWWLPEPACTAVESVPRGLLFLLINALTQLACISGVNLLSAKSSAVTVTIVLNIRKLVSFIISTLLFGHTLSTKMFIGSALVFGSGALYGWETSWRIPQQRASRQQQTVTKEKSK